MSVFVQYGCGFSAPESWLNFDSSPTLRVERLPIVGRYVKKNAQRFPTNVKLGNIVNGLGLADNSADGVYASHVLEHLTRHECEIALTNTYRMLKPGGIFRLIVPDLQARCERYVSLVREGDETANNWFMRASYLGLEERPRSYVDKLGRAVGGGLHLWMWDLPSMTAALARAGFVRIRRCYQGDCEVEAFQAVEHAERFHDSALGIEELAVEARKPDPSVT